MTARFRRCSLAAAALFALAPLHAQDAGFQPIAPARQGLYHFDFSKVFYKDDAAFRAAVRRSEALAREARTLRGKVIASPGNLLRALRLSDEFTVTFSKVYVYQHLQYSVDTRKTKLRDAASEMNARLAPQLAFINDEIQRLSPATIEKFIRAEPRLKPYRYTLLEALRYKPHTLSLKEEELLAATEDLMTKWQGDAFDALIERTDWGTVKLADGTELDVRRDASRIGNSDDRAVRKEGYDKTNAGEKQQRDLYAFVLTNRAAARNKLARLRKYRNAMDERFFGMYLTYADVDNAYAAILKQGAIRKKFQNLQRDRIKSFTGYDSVELYDMTMVPPGVARPKFTIDEATRVILDTVSFLGPEYTGAMRNLLNPHNGRLDIVAGENRVPGAFTYPMPYGQSPFYSYAYEGYLQDVSTLIHEGGHAVNQSLKNNARVLPANMYGPSYFTESYSIFNEMVLHDRLYRQATDPGQKVYYLEQLLQQMLGFYGTTRIAAVEKAIYEGVDAGKVRTADDLDNLVKTIGRQVSIWHDLDPTTNGMWATIPHFYRGGTPYENYVFADLLAQRYFAMYKADPAAFAKRYVAMQRNGYDDSPPNLLRKFMGIDLKDPKVYDAVFAQQARYLAELETLYKQVPVQR